MKPLGSGDPVVVGSFRILGVLGGGGMGRVYLGESRSGRRVAIKVIRSELAEDTTFRRRFAREVAAIRTVSPLFTAAVVEADPEADAPWVATTYIEGPTLSELVSSSGKLASGAVLTLAAGLADALSSIHRAGLVHRDIKPSNVIINDLGPHVIDFGIALTVDASNLTTSLLLGTPSYIAPEIIHGADPSPASDVFSLGSTLAFAATGRHLVSEGTVHAQILRMTMGRFDLAAVPRELKPLIVRCLSPRPRDRPTADELTRIIMGSGVAPNAAPGWFARPDAAPPLSVPPPPITLGGQRSVSRRGVLIGGALVGAAAVGAVAGAAAAVFRPPATFQAAMREAEATPTPTPTPAPGPRRPGSVLWQAKSGTDSVVGAPAGPAGGSRVIVSGTTIVGSHAGQVFAIDPAGTSRWRQPLPTGVVTLRPWGDAVLVTDARTAWLLRLADGSVIFTANLVGPELIKATAEGQTSSAEIGAVVVGTDRAFVGLGSALIAIDRTGNLVWRISRGASPPVGSPVATRGPWLLTHDALPTASGTPPYRLALWMTGNGARRWVLDYMPAPFVAPAGPPPGPQGAPPGGTGGPPAGGPPPVDEAWQRHEATIGPNQVVVRDAQEIRVLSLDDHHQLWFRSSPTPVAGMDVVGETVVVAADKLAAYSVGGGTPRWQADFRGARVAGTLDGRAVVVASDSAVTAIDTGGTTLWETPLPASVAGTAAVDRVVVGSGEVYLILKPRDGSAPLEVDVIALSLI